MAHHIFQNVKGILVAIGGWKLENAKIHLVSDYRAGSFDFKTIILDYRIT
jgi:hypothetical protein